MPRSPWRRRAAWSVALALVLAGCDGEPVRAPAAPDLAPPAAPARVMVAATEGTVRMEAHFTDLRAGATQDMSILNHVIHLIDNAPAGSTIRAAVHNLSANVVQAALQRAKDRGVAVYVVMSGNHHPGDPADDADTSPEDLQAYLDGGAGTRFRWCVNGGTYTGAGWDGCIPRHSSAIMHSKLFLFSRTKDAAGAVRDWVTWFGSANLTYATGANTYNNTVTVYGDRTLYDNFVSRYWAPLWAKTSYSGNDFYDSASGRGYFGGSSFNLQVYASPEQQTDLVYNRIDYVEPDTACAIRVAQAMFNDTRNDVAQLLASKKRAGCWMSVAVGSIGSQALATLRGAGIAVRRIDTHDKFFLVKGRYAGSAATRRLVFTGSHNLSHSANYLNDELFVKLENDDVYYGFRSSWERMTADEDVYVYP